MPPALPVVADSDRHAGRTIIVIDPKHYRPSEVDLLLGNPEKVMRTLGCKPCVAFEELVEMKVHADLQRLELQPDKSPSPSRIG